MGFLAHYEPAILCIILALWGKDDQNFKVILNYIFGFRLTWTSKNLSQKNQ